MANKSDDEWEYEYDESETEDFYIAVDLSNVPSAQVPMNVERRLGHPTMLKSRLRALNAIRGQLPERPETGSADTNTPAPATMGEVQISGLHTTNPLIKYNDQLLSCQWTSTIGTDMYFTKLVTDAGDLHQPLRSLPSVDLLSLGTAKLVAKVARLRPRDDVVEEESVAQATTAGKVDERMHQEISLVSAEHVDAPAISTNSHPRPPSFLVKLNEAKARRGETSRLVVNRNAEGPRLVSEYVGLSRRPGHDEPGVG